MVPEASMCLSYKGINVASYYYWKAASDTWTTIKLLVFELSASIINKDGTISGSSRTRSSTDRDTSCLKLKQLLVSDQVVRFAWSIAGWREGSVYLDPGMDLIL
ncbi:hypothetical protein Droror1_Dr00013557 [Drosera rotundifolia]